MKLHWQFVIGVMALTSLTIGNRASAQRFSDDELRESLSGKTIEFRVAKGRGEGNIGRFYFKEDGEFRTNCCKPQWYVSGKGKWYVSEQQLCFNIYSSNNFRNVGRKMCLSEEKIDDSLVFKVDDRVRYYIEKIKEGNPDSL